MTIRARRSPTLLGLAIASTFGFVPSADARPALRPLGAAKVRSVDGPGQLTLTTRSGPIRIRLASIDAPRAGECGASEVTAALRGFVKRAGRGFRYELSPIGGGTLLRDPDGRYLATVHYRGWRRDLATDLIRAEWARPGERAAADNPATRVPQALDWNGDGVDVVAAPRPWRGLWATCGGLAHLPAGETVPPTHPVPWTINASGITTAVGPITLNPSLQPADAMTVADISAIARIERTRHFDGCRIWAPSLQLRFWTYGSGPDCGDGVITSVRSLGPDAARNPDGHILGEDAQRLTATFPLLVPERAERIWPLSGPGFPQWAWQTDAELDNARRLRGLVTYASPILPG